jgi:hypothetical protein
LGHLERLRWCLVSSCYPTFVSLAGQAGVRGQGGGESRFRHSVSKEADPFPLLLRSAMGLVGGGIWHGVKGARNSPRVSPTSFLYASVFFEGPAHARRL